MSMHVVFDKFTGLELYRFICAASEVDFDFLYEQWRKSGSKCDFMEYVKILNPDLQLIDLYALNSIAHKVG